MLAQWLAPHLLFGAHVVALRGTLTAEAEWRWTPRGPLLPKGADEVDWSRAIVDASREALERAEIEARELSQLIVETAFRELGSEECEVEAAGATPKPPGRSIFRLHGHARIKVLRRALEVSRSSKIGANDRLRVLEKLAEVLHADSKRLMDIAKLLTPEEIRALAETANSRAT